MGRIDPQQNGNFLRNLILGERKSTNHRTCLSHFSQNSNGLSDNLTGDRSPDNDGSLVGEPCLDQDGLDGSLVLYLNLDLTLVSRRQIH